MDHSVWEAVVYRPSYHVLSKAFLSRKIAPVERFLLKTLNCILDRLRQVECSGLGMLCARTCSLSKTISTTFLVVFKQTDPLCMILACVFSFPGLRTTSVLAFFSKLQLLCAEKWRRICWWAPFPIRFRVLHSRWCPVVLCVTRPLNFRERSLVYGLSM